MGIIFGTQRSKFVHKCALSAKADVISEYIHDKYYLSKFLRSLCLISRDEGHRKMYRTSSVGIRKSDYYQLLNYYYYIHPFSPFRFYWEKFMIFVHFVMLIIVPIMMILFPNNAELLIVIFVYQCVTTANIIVQFFSGYFDESTNHIIFVPIQIFKNYFWQFILDVLASLPIGFCLHIAKCDVPTCHNASYLLLLNCYCLCIYSSQIIKKMEANLTMSRLAQWSVAYLIIILWFSTFLNNDQTIGPHRNMEKQDDLQWMFNLLSVLFGLKITYSTYFGKIMLKHMIIIIISFFIRTIILAHLILLFKGAYASSRKYTSLFKELREFIHYKKLPLAIKNRIFVYYKFKFKRNFYKTNEVWRFLPDHYKFELNKHWTEMWFQSDLFRNCSVPVMHLIMQNLVNDIYLTNDKIFEIGTAVNYIYFLKTGTVAFLNANGHEVFHLDEGNFFSDAALILAELLIHDHTAIAVETCEVYKLSRSDIRDIINLYPEDYRIIMNKFKKRNQRARFSLNEDDVKAYLGLFGRR